MRTATVAILMLFSTITMAQYSLSGHVTEKSNNKGLLGANVSISANNTIIVATDEKGYFEFTNLVQGEYILMVSYIGYQLYSRTINLPGTNNLNIKLEEDPYLQDEVVVTATRAIDNAPLSFSEIDKKELKY